MTQSPLSKRLHRSMCRRRLERGGLTLLEVIVSSLLVAILCALVFPALIRIRDAANRTHCANNLRQVLMAVHLCNDSTQSLPPYSTGQATNDVVGGWWIYLLPYVGEHALYDELKASSNDISANGGVTSTMVVTRPEYRGRRFQVLRCLSDPTLGSWKLGEATTNYLAKWYVFGAGIRYCYAPPQKITTIQNGLSNAVFLAEGYSNCDELAREAFVACNKHNFGITWHAKPSDDPSYTPDNYLMFQVMPPIAGTSCCDPLRAQTAHPMMPVAFGDGSVRSIGSGITLEAWTQLMKPRRVVQQ